MYLNKNLVLPFAASQRARQTLSKEAEKQELDFVHKTAAGQRTALAEELNDKLSLFYGGCLQGLDPVEKHDELYGYEFLIREESVERFVKLLITSSSTSRNH